MTKPKIGIIGDGNVGSALRRGLERSGYLVRGVGKEPAQVRAEAFALYLRLMCSDIWTAGYKEVL